MDLWWLIVPSGACNFKQLQKRECLAIGWGELGSLERYIKKSNGRERLLKGYIQVVGDSVYYGDNAWPVDRAFDQVPDIFIRLMQIKNNDLVVVIEVGSEITYGRAMVRGIAQVNIDAASSYRYDEKYKHSHCVCPDTIWYEWDRVKMGELQMPQENFRTLTINNEQIEIALQGLERVKDPEKAN